MPFLIRKHAHIKSQTLSKTEPPGQTLHRLFRPLLLLSFLTHRAERDSSLTFTIPDLITPAFTS